MQKTVIQDIYREILEELKYHPEIKGTKKGLLYKTILIVNEEDNEKTQLICDELGIKSNARLQEDKEIFIDLIDLFYNDELIPRFLKQELIINGFQDFKKGLIQFWMQEETPMEWIIIAAVGIVGVFGSRQFLNNRRNKKRIQKEANRPPIAEKKEVALPPLEAIVSLVISASTVREFNLKEEEEISLDILKELIDKTYYFSCNNRDESDINERNLEMVNEPVLADSPREVYLKINVRDGRNLLDKQKPIKLRYTLKGNLPERGKFRIERVACLGSLSGLERFVRP